ncbi:MAG: virulence RhuM family protein [Bacteroidetes bacterium]|nr:virulence RhuM family protein [Bacteroidota bacterium]
MKNEIILYKPNELSQHIEVRMDGENETVWLNQYQLAELFETDRTSIAKHLQNIYTSGELDEKATCAKIAQVRKEGNRLIKRDVLNYNLDAILSVGYRVNSKQGTQFRIWANRILKDYLLKGYAINTRMNRMEDNVDKLSKKVTEIDLQISTHLIPTQGVFFDGQVFDAYELASKIIRSAKQNIVLIDNYIDETTLTHLSKKKKGVSVTLLTKTITKQLTLDLQKANTQYGNITALTFTQSHDRFLIIDQKEIYHLEASLKDLGRKWFAFSKMEVKSVEGIMNEIKELI